LFTTDRSRITHADVRDVLSQDGKRRNMHWNLDGNKHQAIIKINNNDREEIQEHVSREGRFTAGGGRTYGGPARFIISFNDSQEARRFVREWHRRPLPIQRERRVEDEPPPIVNAEILW